jgi:hypothetical protein
MYDSFPQQGRLINFRQFNCGSLLTLPLVQRGGNAVPLIVGAIISLLVGVFGIYLLVDALWSGVVYVPPAGRYFRNLNPWMYWIGVIQTAVFLYACFFTFISCIRHLIR